MHPLNRTRSRRSPTLLECEFSPSAAALGDQPFRSLLADPDIPARRDLLLVEFQVQRERHVLRCFDHQSAGGVVNTDRTPDRISGHINLLQARRPRRDQCLGEAVCRLFADTKDPLVSQPTEVSQALFALDLANTPELAQFRDLLTGGLGPDLPALARDGGFEVVESGFWI